MRMAGGHKLRDEYWYGFAFCLGIDPTIDKKGENKFDDPTGRFLLLAQIHQGSPHSPPVSLHIVPGSLDENGTAQFQLRVNNSSNTTVTEGTGGLNSTPSNSGIIAFEGRIPRYKWQSVVLRVRMVPSEASYPGYIDMYLAEKGKNLKRLNPKGKPDKNQWVGRAGYNIESLRLMQAPAADVHSFEMGVYREKQSKGHTILFDNFRLVKGFVDSRTDADALRLATPNNQ